MAVVVIVQWEGLMKDPYEKARKVVNWEGNTPKGLMLHVASFDQKGIRVTDVWESEKDFNHYVQSRLVPGMQQIGVQGQPKAEVYSLHALFTPAFKTK